MKIRYLYILLGLLPLLMLFVLILNPIPEDPHRAHHYVDSHPVVPQSPLMVAIAILQMSLFLIGGTIMGGGLIFLRQLGSKTSGKPSQVNAQYNWLIYIVVYLGGGLFSLSYLIGAAVQGLWGYFLFLFFYVPFCIVHKMV